MAELWLTPADLPAAAPWDETGSQSLNLWTVPMKHISAVGALLALALTAACGDDGATDAGTTGGDERIQVVASFFPIAEAAQSVGGDLVEVTNLTPTGTEPHDLELRPRQVDEVQDADLVLYLGQGFQPAVEDVAEGRDGPSVDLLDGLPLEEGAVELDEHGNGDEEEGDEHADEGDEHGEAARDPHFWLDPTLMSQAVDEVEQALAEVAPEQAETFAANADAYQDRLAELDEEFQTSLATCQRRVIVTSHAAFHYLAKHYDLEQRPIAGLSPESEPAPQRLAELADLIADQGVTTVFYETLVTPDVAETLAREAGVDTAVLNPLEGLTDDEVEEGKDYAAVMRDNLAALVDALGCS